MYQAVEPGFGCRPCELAGAVDMDRLKGCIPALDIERDRIDCGIGAFERGADRVGITQVGLDPNQAVASCAAATAFGMAGSDANVQAMRKKGVDNAAAEEACAAEHGDAGAHGLPVSGGVARRSVKIGSLAHWAVRTFHWREDIDLRALVCPMVPPATVAGGTIVRLVGESRWTKPADLHDPVSSVEG
jgi:hypothetical protein